MREIRRAVKRIDIPTIFAARLNPRSLFSNHFMGWPLRADTLENELLRRPIRLGDQVRIALVFDLDPAAKKLHQQRPGFTRDRRHSRYELEVIGSLRHEFRESA